MLQIFLFSFKYSKFAADERIFFFIKLLWYQAAALRGELPTAVTTTLFDRYELVTIPYYHWKVEIDCCFS